MIHSIINSSTYLYSPITFDNSPVKITTYPGDFSKVLPDSNGNITELVNNDGGLLAHYEYSAYGEVTAMSGVEAENNSMRFSTKYWEREFKKYNYGHRHLDSITGRWTSQDPIGEHAGRNLYGFVHNSAICFIDNLGLVTLVMTPADINYAPPRYAFFGMEKYGATVATLTLEPHCECNEKTGKYHESWLVDLHMELYLNDIFKRDPNYSIELGVGAKKVTVTMDGAYGHEQRHMQSYEIQVRKRILSDIETNEKVESSKEICEAYLQERMNRFYERWDIINKGELEHAGYLLNDEFGMQSPNSAMQLFPPLRGGALSNIPFDPERKR